MLRSPPERIYRGANLVGPDSWDTKSLWSIHNKSGDRLRSSAWGNPELRASARLAAVNRQSPTRQESRDQVDQRPRVLTRYGDVIHEARVLQAGAFSLRGDKRIDSRSEQQICDSCAGWSTLRQITATRCQPCQQRSDIPSEPKRAVEDPVNHEVANV